MVIDQNDGVRLDRDILNRVHMGRDLKEKKQIPRSAFGSCGKNATRGRIKERSPTKICFTAQRWGRGAELHAASLCFAVPRGTLPGTVFFPNRHPGKVLPAKTV